MPNLGLTAVLALCVTCLIRGVHAGSKNSIIVLSNKSHDTNKVENRFEALDENPKHTEDESPQQASLIGCTHSEQHSSQLNMVPQKTNDNYHDEQLQFVKSPVDIPSDHEHIITITDVASKSTEDQSSGDADQHDLGYEMVNHRLTIADENEFKEDYQLAVDHMKSNWNTWRSILSFFPSSKDILSKQRNAEHKIPVKSNNLLLESPVAIFRQQNGSKNENKIQDGANIMEITVAPVVYTSEDKVNELDQQFELTKYRQPISMYIMDDENLRLLHIAQNAGTDTNEVEIPGSIMEIKETNSKSLPLEHDSFGEATAERARNSLLKAAEVAKQLADRTTTTERPLSLANTTSGWSIESPINTRMMETLDIPQSRPANSNSADQREVGAIQLKPKFLGFGQLQRIEPFNGNQRMQARLSCQFGLRDNVLPKNMTISDVEWTHFSGQYDYDSRNNLESREDPLFDQCQKGMIGSCLQSKVRNDVFTTVHPRPEVQNYINTVVPSYSITIHEVKDNHYGLYRCSALRKEIAANRTIELVYRLIPFE